MENINMVDLAFIVDTTGSMGSLISAAQLQMVALLTELSQAAQVHLQLGIVEYRDHPPQDQMVYKVHEFTADLKRAQQTIRSLSANGGGDSPEAVLDGIVAACHDLAWRPHARRLAVLVGDAPPHGVGTPGDAFARGCPCGETLESVTRLAEATRVNIYALGLAKEVAASFSTISMLTGGKFYASNNADKAIEHLAGLLKAEFGKLELDRSILNAYLEQQELSMEELATRVGSSRHEVSAAFLRLLSRDLIKAPATQFAD
ncbi:VWA domain-containing protein [Ktedonosporobacter rubrisoli]|uniref:VWA domain-containing protein n=1 Tax=Ktedonosporobacter rubrisoli TaxID=2509675 RepID=A0A4P6K4C8_KTERU|nr:VWA domain-containing protein [Ktedonosporobacter rubrisoli]QBD82680.1 VWA domain-containing protein [Ktedonosporobacter rubrisoli]